MKVKFVLIMKDLQVGEQQIDELEFSWSEDFSQDEILKCSRKWITTPHFLTDSMDGLNRVGKSELTIEPVDHENYII